MSAKTKKADLEAMKLQAMIKTEVHRAFDRGIYDGTGKTLIVMCYILHNSFGFGEKRLKKIVEESEYLFECADEGRVSIDDMAGVLKDECDFDVKDGLL